MLQVSQSYAKYSCTGCMTHFQLDLAQLLFIKVMTNLIVFNKAVWCISLQICELIRMIANVYVDLYCTKLCTPVQFYWSNKESKESESALHTILPSHRCITPLDLCVLDLANTISACDAFFFVVHLYDAYGTFILSCGIYIATEICTTCIETILRHTNSLSMRQSKWPPQP